MVPNIKTYLREGTTFSIPCIQHDASDDDLKFDPSGDDSVPAEIDRSAKGEVGLALQQFNILAFPRLRDVISSKENVVLLSKHLDALCLRSSPHFMASVIGHLPYNILKVLISIVFFDGSRDEDPTVVEGFLSDLSFKKPLAIAPYARRLAKHLMNSDALHQSLLRSSRTLMANFSSPFAMTEEVMPAFTVYDEGSGKARPGFLRRDLVSNESLHPILNRIDEKEAWHQKASASNGSASVVPTLAMFKRAFKVFTCGLIDNVDLARDKAVVAGGAVSACLSPWPAEIADLYQQEQECRTLLLQKLKVPTEIAHHIESFSGEIKRREMMTDLALMNHFASPDCPYMGSDIDIFFVCPPGSMDVSAAAKHLPVLHSQILKSRAAIDLSQFDVKSEHSLFKKHWIRSLPGPEDDFLWRVAQSNAKGIDDIWEVLDQAAENPDANEEEEDDMGWTPYMKSSVAARFKYLWTVRTTNSVTICGAHPVRHTQLMMHAVRAPEQIVYPFDLDCVAVFYDGTNVYSTDRAMRSFNTQANFVDVRSLADRARALRMVKYATRGFSTMVFEICRHAPRCDIHLSEKIKDVLLRQFPRHVEYDEKVKDVAYSEEYEMKMRFHPDLGNPEREPYTISIGMDYVPTPLLYGPNIDAQDLHSQIQTFQWPEDSPPLLLKLKYKLTSNSKAFMKSLLKAQGNQDRFVPLQFKHVKDSWLSRRIKFGTAFHICYMCGKDVGVDPSLKKVRTKGKNVNDEGESDDMMDEGYEGQDEMSEDDVDMKESRSEGDKRKVAVCTKCMEFNKAKKEEVYDLFGKYAVVTGGRIKIGKEVTLRLLRSGATVIATTRFPLLMAKSFSELPDSPSWWSRLRIFGIDFRNVAEVIRFTEYLKGPTGVPRIDILIQNAAQTIWRPPEYYQPMVLAEDELARTLPENIRRTWVHLSEGARLTDIEADSVAQGKSLALASLSSESTGFIGQAVGNLKLSNAQDVSASALMTQLNLSSASPSVREEFIPKDWNIAAGVDPTDPRSLTTWNTQLDQVPVSEIAEALIINSFVPTILIQRLHPLLASRSGSGIRESPAFIVNVSSREGSFTAPTLGGGSGIVGGDFGGDDTGSVHPHTNMAKAALNRLTQTCAASLIKEGIYMTAVDPGWVSIMGPSVTATGFDDREGGKMAIEPPLSEEDGAARVLDPVFSGLKYGVFHHGVLLRNFKPSSW
ncbi:hypothetical protein HDU97_007839 [Phlyctochytrium planicorne]|nr:hypothetical protein HDU97_007839 [Phlyctochytrium planicorne]